MRTTTVLAGALAIGVALTALTGIAAAQERFQPVGSVTYTPAPASEQYGTFEIPAEQSRISSLRFRIEEGTTDIRSFRVRYRDGDSERFTIRDSFEAGDRTEIFELEDGRRVRSIEIAYTPRGKVKIALLADSRRAEPEPPPQPEPPPPLAWRELGCNVVSFLNDNDDVNIAPAARIANIRLKAEGFDIQVSDFRATFSDGSSERYRVNSVVPAGARTGAIDLRAASRRLAKIEINYGSTGFGTRPARMCIDGQ